MAIIKTLPLELIEQILLCVLNYTPWFIKPLRLVCKNWNSILTTESFRMRYPLQPHNIPAFQLVCFDASATGIKSMQSRWDIGYEIYLSGVPVYDIRTTISISTDEEKLLQLNGSGTTPAVAMLHGFLKQCSHLVEFPLKELEAGDGCTNPERSISSDKHITVGYYSEGEVVRLPYSNLQHPDTTPFIAPSYNDHPLCLDSACGTPVKAKDMGLMIRLNTVGRTISGYIRRNNGEKIVYDWIVPCRFGDFLPGDKVVSIGDFFDFMNEKIQGRKEFLEKLAKPEQNQPHSKSLTERGVTGDCVTDRHFVDLAGFPGHSNIPAYGKL